MSKRPSSRFRYKTMRKDLALLTRRKAELKLAEMLRRPQDLRFGMIDSFSFYSSTYVRSLATISNLSGAMHKRRRLIQFAKKVSITICFTDSPKTKQSTGNRRAKWRKAHNLQEKQ